MKREVYIVLVLAASLIVGCGQTKSTPSTRGVISGGTVSSETDSYDEKIAQQEKILKMQEAVKEQQRREYQDLQRQEYENNRVRDYSAE